tara:strand:- start:1003 stop:1548 length:546 start_codon:yes stop_codon:yes gene_type:complete
MSNKNLPQWRQDLKSSIIKEGKLNSNRWVQFATITSKHSPRLRTVVFRGWKSANSMLIYTDNRSEKIKEIEQNNNIEILWLFSKSKSQFRFKGKAYELSDTQMYWDNLTPQSKVTWYWPYPGKKVNKEKLNIKENKLVKPNNFSVLEIKVTSVDLLQLVKPVHKRYKWEIKNNWEKIELNP